MRRDIVEKLKSKRNLLILSAAFLTVLMITIFSFQSAKGGWEGILRADGKSLRSFLVGKKNLSTPTAVMPAIEKLEEKKVESETVTKEPEKIAEAPAAPAPTPTPVSKPASKPVEKPKAVAPKAKPKATPVPKAAPKPVAKPATIPAPTSASRITAIITLINEERRLKGLAPVVENAQLDHAAFLKSKHMFDKKYFAHTAPDGTSDINFVNQVGYRYSAVGTNLAQGDFGSDQGVVQAWMNSSGHRANILASFGQQIGIGIYGNYFTMIIGKPL